MSGVKQIDGYKIYMSKMLGQGSYGAVYIGISDKTGEEVAVKILKKKSIDADEYLKSALFNEIKIMQTLKSDNVVGFFDVMESANNYYIVQQLCDGDLTSVIKPGQKISEEEARDYLLQICNGFLALVRQGIIHRDLKPANIMRKGNVLKIGDFGFSKKTQASRVQQQTIVGTPLYMSLEILKDQPYSSKCDIWALAFIFYEMLHGRTPWTATSEYKLIKTIETKPLQMDENLSEETKDFLRRSLQIHESDRISWDELFTHPIFNGYFIQHSSGNTEFQNKLKTIMSDLRFQIHSQNLDLCRIMAGLGYKDGNSSMNKHQFYQFLKIIYPNTKKSQSDYIFDKVDIHHKGSVTIKDIENLMTNHGIGLTSVWRSIPGVQQKPSNGPEVTTMSPETEEKVRNCFIKLLHILQSKNMILEDAFLKFDKGKSGGLTRSQFKTMIFQITSELHEQQINGAFDLIDTDNSNSISFQELNIYFSKVNGIPEHLNRHDEKKMDIEQPKSFHRLFQQNSYNPNTNPYSNQQAYGYQNFPPPPQGYYYPPQQMMYQPPMQPQQQPQQPQQYNNFIMNQLSMNMNTGSQQPQQPQNWYQKPQ